MDAARASADVPAPADEVFAFLADLRNHWRLAARWIEVLGLLPQSAADDGGTVRLSGPLGLARTVTTRVDQVVEPTAIDGHGVCGTTRAAVSWRLAERGPVTHVSVEVRLLEAGARDRVIWRAGGRRWLAGRLAQTLSALTDQPWDQHRNTI